jgi:hypothetical protein
MTEVLALVPENSASNGNLRIAGIWHPIPSRACCHATIAGTISADEDGFLNTAPEAGRRDSGGGRECSGRCCESPVRVSANCVRHRIAASRVMLHLRSCYVSKAAILTVPAPPVPVENRSPA